jgi:hypothetical protein
MEAATGFATLRLVVAAKWSEHKERGQLDLVPSRLSPLARRVIVCQFAVRKHFQISSMPSCSSTEVVEV